MERFFYTSICQDNHDYWWPGDSSPYSEIKHLLPNHYLDLTTREVIRYWPSVPLKPMAVSEAVKEGQALLQNLMKGAANRFALKVGITAGWDSRLLLAATKGIKHEVSYYTLLYWNMTKNHPDVSIPADLLGKIGLTHQIISCPSQMSTQFKSIYMNNVTTAHPAWGPIAEGFLGHFPPQTVAVKANGGEVIRSYYELAFFEPLNGGSLAKLTQMGGNTFAIRSYNRWLSTAKAAAEANNLNPLDLFYWENRMGNWQAMSQLEWDIAQETFTPFNCRRLLELFLSTPKRYRKGPDYELFVRLISALWPELLQWPINPESSRTKAMAKNFLAKAGLLKVSKRTINQLRRRIANG